MYYHIFPIIDRELATFGHAKPKKKTTQVCFNRSDWSAPGHQHVRQDAACDQLGSVDGKWSWQIFMDDSPVEHGDFFRNVL